MRLPPFLPKPSAPNYHHRPRLRWPLLVRRVAGTSMLPLYQPGQLVVAWGWCRRASLRTGDVVLLRHNGLEKIKRIARVDMRTWQIYVTGDNVAHSTDSRSFGWLDASVVRARVVWPRPHGRARSMAKRRVHAVL